MSQLHLLIDVIEPQRLVSFAQDRMTKLVAKVAVVPGHDEPFSYFGPGGEGHIRIVYSTSRGIIEEAMDRIEKALTRL